MVVLYVCVIFFLAIYYILLQYKKNHYHFDVVGIKYLPGVPVFGNVFRSTFLFRHILDDLSDVYNAFPDERYVGYVAGNQRIIMVRDPELMKSIVVKDFAHFVDRKVFFPKRVDPLIGNSIISVQEKDWRKMRPKLTPGFTTSKIKNMTSTMLTVSQEYVDSLQYAECEDVELYEIIVEYSTEMLATYAFGFEKSLTEDVKKVFNFAEINLNFGRRVLYFLSMQYPALGDIFQFFGIQLLPKKVTQSFRETVLKAIKNRQEQNIVKQDYLQVLMDASDGWTVDEIVGQVFFAFLANFDTGTTIISLGIHQLALNPDVQEKLYQEIRRCEEVSGGLTYENLSELKYLDCVMNESSRKYSAALIMDRICTKPYYLPPPREGGKPYLVKPGDVIYNVVNAIHDDPKYHPDPDVFRPERFSDHNKHNIKQFTFMPFGMGPRGCLAGRLMKIQMKVILYHFLLRFKVHRCEKTADPVRFIPDEFSIRPLGGSWVRLEKRI